MWQSFLNKQNAMRIAHCKKRKDGSNSKYRTALVPQNPNAKCLIYARSSSSVRYSLPAARIPHRSNFSFIKMSCWVCQKVLASILFICFFLLLSSVFLFFIGMWVHGADTGLPRGCWEHRRIYRTTYCVVCSELCCTHSWHFIVNTFSLRSGNIA